MKRILSLVLVLTCILSSFTFLANAEESTEPNTETNTGHVHERNPVGVYYTETTHEYQCLTCKEYYVEDHIPDEKGKCPCGYFDHEHKPEAWAMLGRHTEEIGAYHSYLCSECSIIAEITEKHTFDENGVCPCGYVDAENENADPIAMLRMFFKMIPQAIDFIIKMYSKLFSAAFEMVN